MEKHRFLYEVFKQLFSLTVNNPLSCLNYYEEDDGLLLAEIKNTELLSIEERIFKHSTLLKQVQRGSNSLEYSHEPLFLITDDEKEQLSLFSKFS